MEINQIDKWSERGDRGILKSAEQIQAVSHLTESTLNPYEWMRRLQIKVNWEIREIHLDNENLRVDSSSWEVKKIWRHNIKINPEGDITEYLDWEEKWEQLFDNMKAAEREAKKLWKRLAFEHDENNEFQAIIDEVWVEEFMKFFPGYRLADGSGFWYRGERAYFWSASTDWGNVHYMAFNRGTSRAYRSWGNRASGFSVRLVKD